ncbi:MAG: hypothetical protein HQL65_07160 [Magnetococcales bacterium]|nr:hypothetical protein [Magnetococcales bacterium]
MTRVAIPHWNIAGVIPPVNSARGNSSDRSPYPVSLLDLVERFSTSPERMKILDGLLRCRAALHGLGLTQGFQWLNGSFLEHVEKLEKRSPRDIDVVTFYHLPPGETQRSLIEKNATLFDLQQSKNIYFVDHYLQQMRSDQLERLVTKSVYWYSMWSHRRDKSWKGYLQINLAPDEDAAARTGLDESSL